MLFPHCEKNRPCQCPCFASSGALCKFPPLKHLALQKAHVTLGKWPEHLDDLPIVSLIYIYSKLVIFIAMANLELPEGIVLVQTSSTPCRSQQALAGVNCNWSPDHLRLHRSGGFKPCHGIFHPNGNPWFINRGIPKDDHYMG